jgi:hypothetical protein
MLFIPRFRAKLNTDIVTTDWLTNNFANRTN